MSEKRIEELEKKVLILEERLKKHLNAGPFVHGDPTPHKPDIGGWDDY
jgi:hypothetical protein